MDMILRLSAAGSNGLSIFNETVGWIYSVTDTYWGIQSAGGAGSSPEGVFVHPVGILSEKESGYLVIK